MNRRNFIRTSSVSLASLLITDSLISGIRKQINHLINFPDEVTVIADDQFLYLSGKEKQFWTYRDIAVNLENSGESILVEIQAPAVKLSSIALKWNLPPSKYVTTLNDHWEGAMVIFPGISQKKRKYYPGTLCSMMVKTRMGLE